MFIYDMKNYIKKKQKIYCTIIEIENIECGNS